MNANQLSARSLLILVLIPIGAMAALWIWLSWVFGTYQVYLQPFDKQENLFTVQAVALYLLCFVFASTVANRRISWRSGALVLLFSFLVAWPMVTGFGYGWYLKLGAYVTALLTTVVSLAFSLGEGSWGIGLLIFPVTNPLTAGVLLGLMVFIATRWVSRRPFFKENAAAEIAFHVIGLSCAVFILLHLTLHIDRDLKDLREAGAAMGDYAARFAGILFLPPLVHLAFMLLYRKVFASPTGSLRSNRAIIVVSCIVFIAVAAKSTLVTLRSTYGPPLSIATIFWPSNIIRPFVRMTEDPRHDTPLEIAGYRLAIDRNRIDGIWDSRSRTYVVLRFQYWASDRPLEDRKPPTIEILRVDTPTKWRRLACDEPYDEAYLLCDETKCPSSDSLRQMSA